MKTYQGTRGPDGCQVTVERRCATPQPLNPRFDLWNHSPAGLDWGNGGPGAAQLALAILADHLGDDRRAIELQQPFKWRLIANLDRGGFTLASAEIERALSEIAPGEPVRLTYEA